MVEYEETPEEVHAQLREEKKEEKKPPTFLEKLTTNQKIIIAGIVMFIVYSQYVKGQNTQNTIYLLAVLGAILYFLTANKEATSVYLDEQTIKIELYRKLKYKQLHPLGNHFELPMGDICIDMPTKERWLESHPWKRVVGFYIKDSMTRLKDYWIAVVDIRTADIKDIRKGYFDGSEAPDLRWVNSPSVTAEERYLRTIGRRRPIR